MRTVRGKLTSWGLRLAAGVLLAAGLLHGWRDYQAVAAHDSYARENVEVVLALGGPVAVVVVGLTMGWVSVILAHLVRAEWQSIDALDKVDDR